ncbi:LysR family transcriptional regulator [Nannocystis pusilla]|uniref:LysR family transcriptional regulator n=1 Tax=Nannocystis pusilla TaxID=889268 RepID=A0ABS7TZW8_9BACT|nr:LysR family transcriptional regulator [Nannocystis pusilla]MBZ5713818.1 LysR family transcriptional regulator [Nannocystis pusilla]
MHSVDWDDLRYVLALARDRTLSRAAERLHATHSTVGRRLRAIEQSLGVRLFDATPEGFVPTTAGRETIAVAERVEAEMLALEAKVLGRDTQLEGPLRVATMDMLFQRYHAVFAEFIALYPRVALTVLTGDDELSLTRREADVAFRMTNSPPEYAVGRKVGRVDFAVYASRSLVERVGAGAGLAAFPWIHWDERLNMRWLDEWLAVHAPGARVALRVGANTRAVHDAVAAGIGAHFLACFDGDADESLVRISAVDPKFSRDLWLLTLNEMRSNSRVRAFIDHVDAHTRSR